MLSYWVESSQELLYLLFNFSLTLTPVCLLPFRNQLGQQRGCKKITIKGSRKEVRFEDFAFKDSYYGKSVKITNKLIRGDLACPFCGDLA